MTVPEDKLSHDERLRLESVAQAVALVGMTGPRPSVEKILSDAGQIERFIRGD